jgi:hypothetical protein
LEVLFKEIAFVLLRTPQELRSENSSLDTHHAQEVCDRIAVAALQSIVSANTLLQS